MNRHALARTIIDANRYMTLATADADGRPWATPVWFASADGSDFVWLSRPATRHSANIAVRPQVGLVIFDSTVPIGRGQAVYVEAVAGEIPATDLDPVLDAYSAAAVADGGRPFTRADVVEPGAFRLYRARAVAHYVLDEHDSRVPVDPRSTVD